MKLLLCRVLKSKWGVDLFICFSETVISPIKNVQTVKAPLFAKTLRASIYFFNVM